MMKIVEEARQDFPKKEHCSKVYGTPQDYDEYNVFDYKNYDVTNIESCQELVGAFEKWFEKWFGIEG